MRTGSQELLFLVINKFDKVAPKNVEIPVKQESPLFCVDCSHTLHDG